jgi:ATP-dependent DNA helicase RecG
LPRAYRDWRTPQAIGALDAGEAVIVGRIGRVRERPGRFPLVSADVTDATGTIAAKWFGRRHLFGKLPAGERLFIAGRVTRGPGGVEINVTNHRVLAPDEAYAGEIVPVYGATKELSSRQIRTTIAKNFSTLIARRVDALPPQLVRKFAFPPFEEAWRDVHMPGDPADVERGRRRIVFEEFFGIALAAALKRARREAAGGATAIARPAALWEAFCAQLPFVPTTAQERVIETIWTEMTRASPMNRLLQGDVGSGKTLVAAAAVVLAHSAGLQSAFMAPTEILAAQHAAKLAPLLLPFGIAVEAVFGSLGARERREAREHLRSGAAALAVGTHALLTESVEFARLGLVIIDEQHRFGVAQRARLREKSGSPPHTLYMTATPIPRTLAQTRYADLDLSVIDELPPGRTPIETYVLRASRKGQAYEFVRKNVRLGRQAYVVAPAIDASESALTGALHEAERIRRDVFPELRVDVLHGKLPPREKDVVMQRFARGETDVLVATTVVEVGVDVPNASVMVILDAHRYGLAQLHQLRGRVGRGVERSFCLLIAPDDAADVERLEILAGTTDGFKIAEEDLRLRREGEFAGTAQAGAVTGTIGNIVADFELYMKAKAEADAIVAGDPELSAPEHRRLLALVDGVAAARALLVTS